jgi:hypothetical protein
MKLEYFDQTGNEKAVLLLHSGTPREVDSLRAALAVLRAAGASVALHELDFVEAMGGCEVTLSSADAPRGVRPAGPRAFLWSMSPSDWERVQDLLEPFVAPLPAGAGTRFQYLHEHGGPEVIYSTAREW